MTGKVTTRGQGVIMPNKRKTTTSYAKGGAVAKKQFGGLIRRDDRLPQPTGIPTPRASDIFLLWPGWMWLFPSVTLVQQNFTNPDLFTVSQSITP